MSNPFNDHLLIKQADPVSKASQAPKCSEGHNRGAGGPLHFGQCGCKQL